MLENYVICKICGVQKKRLSRHLKLEHNLTSAEYKVQYSGEVIAKSEIENICKGRDRVIAKLSKEERRARLDNANKTLKNDPEARSRRSKKAWETIKSSKELYQAKCKSFSDGIQKVKEEEPERFKEWQRKAQEGFKNSVANRSDGRKNEISEMRSKLAKEYWEGLDDKTRELHINNRSKGIKKHWKRLTDEERYNRFRVMMLRTVEASNGIKVRSKSEAKFIEHLLEQKIDFEYETYRFELNVGTYIPDFYLPQYNTFIEVKSEYFYNSAKEKVEEALEVISSMGHNYIVLFDDVIFSEFCDVTNIVDSFGTSGSQVLVRLDDIVRPCTKV